MCACWGGVGEGQGGGGNDTDPGKDWGAGEVLGTATPDITMAVLKVI